VLRFIGEEAWRIRCSGVRHASLRWGASELANPAGVNYESHAEKIPGDKKHVKGILSQSHCVAQFNTAQNRPLVRLQAIAPGKFWEVKSIGYLNESDSGPMAIDSQVTIASKRGSPYGSANTWTESLD
jgi:hypothetical protein